MTSGSSAKWSLTTMIFLAGAALRCVLMGFLSPHNNDNHWAVIRHIMENRALVIANVYEHSFHPQLYHVLAIPFAAVGGAKGAQFLSLLFSIATLWVLKRLMEDRELFPDTRFAAGALSFAAFLPTFVVNGLYVANDTMAIFLGSALALQLWRLMQKPDFRQLLWVAALLGLGLSAKGTLLALVPPVGIVLLWVFWTGRVPASKLLPWGTAFLALFLLLGSYKFIENQRHFGKPIVHNLDRNPEWAEAQKPVYIGRESVMDLNVTKLVREPTLQNRTRYSIPLLMYGSFWYKYWSAENNLRGWQTKWIGLGGAFNLLGLLPTGAFLIGAVCILLGVRIEKPAELYRLVLMLFFVMSLILVLIAGFKYDVTSCFQSRLIFGGFAGVMACFAVSGSRIPNYGQWVLLTGAALMSVLSLLYFGVELTLL